MKLRKEILLAAMFFLAFSLNIFAETNAVTATNSIVTATNSVVAATNSVVMVTNFVTVTVTVTNIVTITNLSERTALLVKGEGAKPVEIKPAAPAKYPWNSLLTAGLTLTRGNSESLLATTKFVTDKKTPINEFNIGADATYGSASGVANSEIIHGVGQWNHLFSEKWYAYLRGEGLHDGIAEVKYRATITSGVGYYLLKNTNTTLALEAGPGLVLERVGTVDTTYATMRLAERFEHKFNKNSARVWENVEVLPQVDKVSDYLINAEVGVESALYKSLSLQVYLDDNFNSQPAADHKRNDVKLVSGITYKF